MREAGDVLDAVGDFVEADGGAGLIGASVEGDVVGGAGADLDALWGWVGRVGSDGGDIGVAVFAGGEGLDGWVGDVGEVIVRGGWGR